MNSLQIIDTVLLKTYLQSSPSMISSLLRLKENFCLYNECEKLLTKSNKIPELVLLMKKANKASFQNCMFNCFKGSPVNNFENHFKHLNALHLLVDSKLENKIDQINEYLADLTDFGIILDFGAQLIKTNPDIALNIFTFDGEPEKWPRDKVYELFKSSNAPTQMRVPLIEHYIEQVCSLPVNFSSPEIVFSLPEIVF